MGKKFLSVIIPVFNTKIELLKKCIHSVAQLNVDDVEIIIIDDFSNLKTKGTHRLKVTLSVYVVHL